MSTADLRAQLAAANASAAQHPVPIRQRPDIAPGVAAWQVGSALVLQPELADDAPPRLRANYEARIVALATGRCPRCDAVQQLTSTTTAGLQHQPDCDVARRWTHTESLLLDPRGVAYLAELTGANLAADLPRLR